MMTDSTHNQNLLTPEILPKLQAPQKNLLIHKDEESSRGDKSDRFLKPEKQMTSVSDLWDL